MFHKLPAGKKCFILALVRTIRLRKFFFSQNCNFADDFNKLFKLVLNSDFELTIQKKKKKMFK